MAIVKNDKDEEAPVPAVLGTGEGADPVVAGVPETQPEHKAVGTPPPGRIRAFMLTKFPGREWKDDAELHGHAAEWMEQADRSLGDYQTADDKLRRIAEEYPEIMAIADDLTKDPGLPLGVAIRRNIDEDELEVGEDDPGFDVLRKKREERAGRRKTREEYEQQLDKNLDESRAIVQQYLTDNEVSEEEAAALGKYVDGIMDDYLNGRVTADVLNVFRNAMNYTKDVADAREVGKVEGMNTKIDAERTRKKEATDGLPGPGSSTGILTQPKEEPKDLLDEILGRSEQRRKMME